jgi:hypothetical protein
VTAPLTDAQVAALREAAEKATPGPWTAENRHSDFGPCYNTVRHASGWITDQDGIDKYADARYIAEASPDVVLALLAERDALNVSVVAMVDRVAEVAAERDAMRRVIDYVNAEVSALRARAPLVEMNEAALADAVKECARNYPSKVSAVIDALLEEVDAQRAEVSARETGLRALVERWRQDVAKTRALSVRIRQRPDLSHFGGAGADDHRERANALDDTAVERESCLQELDAALSTPAVHGASEAER